MRRCRICKVPLEGVLGKVVERLFKIVPSIQDSSLCNKCVDKKFEISPAEKKGKYRCQICGREIDESVAISHIKAEEYILGLIKKDHPQWDKDKTTCNKCVEYYRELVKKTEI